MSKQRPAWREGADTWRSERRAYTRVGQAGCTQRRKAGWWGSSLAWEKSRVTGWGQIASAAAPCKLQTRGEKLDVRRKGLWAGVSKSDLAPAVLAPALSLTLALIPSQRHAKVFLSTCSWSYRMSHHPDLPLFPMANPLFPGFSFRLRRSSWPSTYLSFTTILLLHSTYQSGN